MTRILGISGSLREGSYNTALLRAAAELLPPGVEIEEFDLSPIPLYNGDVEATGDPAPAAALRAAVREADALLLATDEPTTGLDVQSRSALWAEVAVPLAWERFDPAGELTDERMRAALAELIEALVETAEARRPEREPVIVGA